ncbi:MAG: DNA translocase FtsK, partial [Sphingobacterium siyangense]
ERFQSAREKDVQEELQRPAFTHHPVPEVQIDPKDKVVLSFDDSPLERTENTPSISFTIDQPNEEFEAEDLPLIREYQTPKIEAEPQQEPEAAIEPDAIPGLVVEDIKEEKEITASDLVAQFGQYDPKLDLSGYQHPALDLLKDYGGGKITINQQELEANKNRIVDTLRNYSIEIESIKATIGPTVTLYEIIPKPGVRISKIKNLEDDIALSLAALGIRIIAPMPGKGTIGIEVPNSSPEMVSMRSVLATEKFQKTDMDLPIALGKTISNEVYIADLAKMPHLLVAGATGQGKSVGINAILTSLLYKKHPAELKFVLVDPKKVELSLFKKVERHFLAKLPDDGDAIITDTKKVINTLNSLCIEMDQRYDLLKNAQVRNLKEYNAKFINRRLNPEEGHRFLPYIVLIVDEFADLMMTAGKEVETPIARLAQLARAVGIHLVIATQRPSVNIITGTIKANFPARLAFRVLSKVDSRTILDTGGADQLIGRG